MADLEEDEDQYYFQPIAHGPKMLRWLRCEYGPTGHCAADKHKDCAHGWGGPQRDGVSGPSGFLQHRAPSGEWSALFADEPNVAVWILPMHVWRCSCSCHTEDGATDLLGLID